MDDSGVFERLPKRAKGMLLEYQKKRRDYTIEFINMKRAMPEWFRSGKATGFPGTTVTVC